MAAVILHLQILPKGNILDVDDISCTKKCEGGKNVNSTLHMVMKTQKMSWNSKWSNKLKRENSTDTKNSVAEFIHSKKNTYWGTSLANQWLRLHASNSGGGGSIPVQGTKISHTMQHGKTKKTTNKTLTEHFLYAHSIPSMKESASWCFRSRGDWPQHDIRLDFYFSPRSIITCPGTHPPAQNKRHTNKNQENIWKVFIDISLHTVQDCEISEK